VVSSPSSVTLQRGALGCAAIPIETVVVERVDLGALGAVQQVTATIPAGATSTAVPITQVDATRTVVFSGTQLGGGQAFGSSHSSTAQARDLSAAFQLNSSGDSVTVVRGGSDGDATFTFVVVELVP
jgi:hypothetical protein